MSKKKNKPTISYKQLQIKNNEYRNKLIKRATPEEIIFKNYLYNNKHRFCFQKGFFKPFHRIADFYLKYYKLIIEIDGGYHKDTIEKDDLKDQLWASLKFRTLRITNEEVLNGSYKQIFEDYIRTHPPK